MKDNPEKSLIIKGISMEDDLYKKQRIKEDLVMKQ